MMSLNYNVLVNTIKFKDLDLQLKINSIINPKIEREREIYLGDEH